MTRSSWTCCLSSRDWAKKKMFTGSCRTWEAGSRTQPSAARALHLLPSSPPLSFHNHVSQTQTDPPARAPLVSAPRGDALESHCGKTCHVTPLSSPGDRLPSEWRQKKEKYPRSTVFDGKKTSESVQRVDKVGGQNAKRNELWSLFSKPTKF